MKAGPIVADRKATFKSDLLRLLLQFERLLNIKPVRKGDGLRAMVDTQFLVHCFGARRERKGVAGVLSKTRPSTSELRDLNKVLRSLNELSILAEAEILALKKAPVENVSVNATSALESGKVCSQSSRAREFAIS